MKSRLVIMAIAALAVAGCGSDQPDAAEPGATTIVGEDGAKMEIKPGDTGTFPAGYTLYPGAKVVTNVTRTGGTDNGTMVAMESSDTPQQITAHYRKQAEAAGIRISTELNSEGTMMLVGEGDGGMVFTLNATPGTTGGTVAYLVVGQSD